MFRELQSFAFFIFQYIQLYGQNAVYVIFDFLDRFQKKFAVEALFDAKDFIINSYVISDHIVGGKFGAASWTVGNEGCATSATWRGNWKRSPMREITFDYISLNIIL